MERLGSLFRRLDDIASWRRIAPWLSVSDTLDWRPTRTEMPDTEGSAAAARASLRGPGHVVLGRALPDAESEALARAIVALRDEGIHPLFVYVFDEMWRAVAAVTHRLSGALGGEVDVVADFWAWCIDPRRDARGWEPHRDFYREARGADGVPSLVNVWLALTPASTRNGCIHVVPLGRDASWPGDLKKLPPEELGEALPIGAGEALSWNANLCHWGGKTDPACEDLRMSAGIFACRRDWPHTTSPRVPAALSFRDRLDQIAHQFLVYGQRELPKDAPLLEWARMTHTMRSLAGVTRADDL
jgi:hypothetical protein